MLQELSSRKRTVENFKEKADLVGQMTSAKNVGDSSSDVIRRYDTCVSSLNETVSVNEKCLEDVQQFLDNLKEFQDNLKQLWETLSSYTGKFSLLFRGVA